MSVEPVEDIFAPAAAAAGPSAADDRRPAVLRATDLSGALVLKHDNVYLLTDAFGDVAPEDGRGGGLYELDTRYLSRYELRLNGRRPQVLRTGGAAGYHGSITLANAASDGLPAHSVAIVRERLLAGGLRERLSVSNHALDEVALRLVITLDSDYADIFEVRGVQRATRGERLASEIDGAHATLAYRGTDHVERRTHVRVSAGLAIAQAPDGAALELIGDWVLGPGESRQAEVSVWPEEDGGAEADNEPVAGDEPDDELAPASASPLLVEEDRPAAAYRAWRQSTAQLRTPHPPTQRALDRGLADIRQLLNDGPLPGERYVAAGVPWYTTLFGRDALICALQVLPYRPQLARDTLLVLGRLQAGEVDDWRDAEPGKILHELRTGEMARAGEVPHSPYYGSIDATPLWLMLLDEYERWTADGELVEELWPNALAALGWIEDHGDRDGDGFVEYQRRSPRGLVNQGWKDSSEGIRWRDGAPVEGPIALVEVQGYVYAARRGMARLARGRGDAMLAQRQEAGADELSRRFDDAFWMAEAGTYALALDGSKNQVDAVTSNPGHALWTGIAPPERAGHVARSLLGPGLWSGWGIRTLAADHAGYNPMAYHLGSIWPHDNAICAAGLARYGLAAEARQVAGALLESTAHFREARLPELYCGFERASSPLPVPYPVACSPQAWAAGAPFHALTALMGLRPDAAAGVLELVAPALPDFLAELSLSGLRVGAGVVDLAFTRRGGMTSVDVLPRGGRLDVVVRH